MATRDRAHKSQKRAKELTRQKKQEEKRQRRHNKRVIAQPDVEETDAKEKDEEREE
jgi:hypothetical protein